MRTILEIVRDSAAWAAGIGALAMSWAGARELRRGHAHPDLSVGPVGASGGVDSGGATRLWVGTREAVRGGVRPPARGRHHEGTRASRVLYRGQRRARDMGVSASSMVWRVRREALLMRRDLPSVRTLSTMEWALCMEVTA